MATLLAEQASGRTLMYILLNDHEDILGRLNLTILSKNSAEMGYRLAKAHTGQNLMSRAIQKLEPIAVRDLNLSKLLARAAASNPASVHTLLNAGFKRKADEERKETLNNSPIILSLYEKELA